MQSAFDFSTYWRLLDRVSTTNRIVRFRDFAAAQVAEPFCILRHDVDYSPAAALRLAELEAARSIAATYFILAGTRYYNVLAPEHAGFVRQITNLGHEVGLHYDVNSFSPFPRSEWLDLLRAQADMLGALAGQSIVSIAMHQPALNGDDPFADASGFINAYDPRFTRDSVYVSDSARAWRDGGWSILSKGPIPHRLQLCLHPINWAEHDRDRETIFRSVHDDLVMDTRRAEADLLARIAVHSGVVEHERRAGESER